MTVTVAEAVTNGMEAVAVVEAVAAAVAAAIGEIADMIIQIIVIGGMMIVEVAVEVIEITKTAVINVVAISMVRNEKKTTTQVAEV